MLKNAIIKFGTLFINMISSYDEAIQKIEIGLK